MSGAEEKKRPSGEYREAPAVVSELQNRLPQPVRDEKLLLKALQHPSYVNENEEAEGLGDNEELELLGDAVLNLVVADYLIRHYEEFNVGQLTQLRARLVNADSLYRTARELDLGSYMLLGKGEARSASGRRRRGLLADGLEALIGAVYLDGGLDKASHFILSLMEDQIRQAAGGSEFRDYKSLLQQTFIQGGGMTPSYKVVDVFGLQHRRGYKVEVWLCDERLGTGLALSKKRAEQLAARHALRRLNRKESVRQAGPKPA